MAWEPTAEQQANLGMGNNPFLGQNNPYMEKLIQDSSQDVVNNYNLSTQPAFNAAMAKSGSFGNEGVAQMNANAQDQLQKNLGSLSNAQRMGDYNQQQGMYQWQQNLLNQQNQFGQNLGENQRQFNLGFGRNIYNDAYSQNMNNLQTGMNMLGVMGGYNATDLNNANAQQNTPLDYWQQFSNAANAAGGQGGSGTSTQGTSSNPWMSAMGGAQMGSQLGQGAMNWWNNYNQPSQGISQSNQQGFENFGNSNNWFGTGTNP